jgi:antitoxin (DNA-binding transcriptional repressor) of toxin-antitoxin stability system
MKRLQNAQDLRRYLASLINRVESGEVEVNLGK